MTLQEDIYGGTEETPGTDNSVVSGGNEVLRYTSTISEQSEVVFQQYFDKTHRLIPGTFGEDLDTYDFDLQHRFSPEEHHSILWGLGLRYVNDNVENTTLIHFLPAYLATRIYSGYVQDEVTLVPDQLRMTLGSKFEHNDFSGFEVQPSVRFSWLLDPSDVLWWAVTRAVRTPSRIDRDFYVPAIPQLQFPGLSGGPDFVSEKLIAYEIGYRLHTASSFSMDASTFYNTYDDLRSLEPGTPEVIANGFEATTYGLELVLDYSPARECHLRAGYAYLHKDFHPQSPSRDTSRGESEGNDPEHRLNIQSIVDLSRDIELSCWIRAVSELTNKTAPVPGYVTVDVQLGWHADQNLTLSIVGKNLLHDQHPEFGTPSSIREIPRGAYAKVVWAY
jgi:iron complex outermembrane receptor protein